MLTLNSPLNPLLDVANVKTYFEETGDLESVAVINRTLNRYDETVIGGLKQRGLQVKLTSVDSDKFKLGKYYPQSQTAVFKAFNFSDFWRHQEYKDKPAESIHRELARAILELRALGYPLKEAVQEVTPYFREFQKRIPVDLSYHILWVEKGKPFTAEDIKKVAGGKKMDLKAGLLNPYRIKRYEIRENPSEGATVVEFDRESQNSNRISTYLGAITGSIGAFVGMIVMPSLDVLMSISIAGAGGLAVYQASRILQRFFDGSLNSDQYEVKLSPGKSALIERQGSHFTVTLPKDAVYHEQIHDFYGAFLSDKPEEYLFQAIAKYNVSGESAAWLREADPAIYNYVRDKFGGLVVTNPG